MVKTAVLMINMGSRRAKASQTKLLAACQRHGLDITKSYSVKNSDDINSAIRSIKRLKPPLVILAGGDGTISQASNLLAGTKLEIGIVPLGTTNNFARSLNLSPDIDEAVKIITSQPTRSVSLGQINRRYFTNVVGVGISAKVADNVTDTAKRRWGRLAYAVVGVRELVRHQPFQVTLTDSDRELEMHFETHQLIIANGRFHAGKEIAKDARVDSRELIVFAIGGRRHLSLIGYMIDFYIGQRRTIRHSSYLIARNIRITTSQPQPVELDGEVGYTTPLSAKIVPRAINVKYRSPSR